ncbi:cytochrome P450 [Nonomuraea sp. NPDC048916]|uniref:cytochrome P450 n=1 Tax=Nonomuraea sp. NPDC048916 TaxID=3154232 RepID=UPI00340E43AC
MQHATPLGEGAASVEVKPVELVAVGDDGEQPVDGRGERLDVDGLNKEVRDQILSMLAAGLETTATLLIWTCHILAHHPRAAHRLHNEVDQALAGRAPRFEDLADLRPMYLVASSLTMS